MFTNLQVLVRTKLDALVSQLAQDNAELSKKVLKSEEDMRHLLQQNLKLQKRSDEIEKEHLTFLRHKSDIEAQLKKKGIDLNDILNNTFKQNENCAVM